MASGAQFGGKAVKVPGVAGSATITKPLPGKPRTDGTISGILSTVARLPQVAVANVTQRGYGRQFILASDAERMGRHRGACFQWRNQEMFRKSPVFPSTVSPANVKYTRQNDIVMRYACRHLIQDWGGSV